MGVGLFGKLPVKRDFVAVNVTRRFLDAWEPFLQTGLATSKLTLGAHWAPAYNSAPLWRFWLGSDIVGQSVIGAWTPSVDGVGRAFPLTLILDSEDGAPPPPEFETNDEWFAAVEAKLIDALEPGVDFEAYVRSLALLPEAKRHGEETDLAGLMRLDEGGVAAHDIGEAFSLTFRAARRFDSTRAYAGESFWWTLGGEGFPTMALTQRGLPTPARFEDFLTGAFESSIRASS